MPCDCHCYTHAINSTGAVDSTELCLLGAVVHWCRPHMPECAMPRQCRGMSKCMSECMSDVPAQHVTHTLSAVLYSYSGGTVIVQYTGQ